ncbi:MAG: hypothetical protein ACRCXQ_05735 [Vagococcus fluvialis]
MTTLDGTLKDIIIKINILFYKLLPDYVALELTNNSYEEIGAVNQSPRNIQLYSNIEEAKLTPSQIIKIYNEIKQMKKELNLIITFLLKFNHDIEIIITKLMKTIS